MEIEARIDKGDDNGNDDTGWKRTRGCSPITVDHPTITGIHTSLVELYDPIEELGEATTYAIIKPPVVRFEPGAEFAVGGGGRATATTPALLRRRCRGRNGFFQRFRRMGTWVEEWIREHGLWQRRRQRDRRFALARLPSCVVLTRRCNGSTATAVELQRNLASTGSFRSSAGMCRRSFSFSAGSLHQQLHQHAVDRPWHPTTSYSRIGESTELTKEAYQYLFANNF